MLIEDPNALYVTFDNIGVGRLMAQEMLKVQAGRQLSPSSRATRAIRTPTFLFQGMMEVLKERIDSGKIKNVCETFTDGWKPDNAQKNMEQCLTSNDNKVDAVVCRKTTAWPAASSRRSKHRALPAPCRSPARTATRPP